MKLTKYEHACMVLQNQGKTLLIDPGELSGSVPLETSYDYVIITHEHGDHIDPEKIKQIYLKNPSVQFFTNQTIFDAHLRKYSPKFTAVEDGTTAQVEGFELEFFGRDHAIIYQTVPCQNSGVLVNGSFYYPGDSLVLPNKPVQLLAVPAAAPWLKTAEAMDFIAAVKPKEVFLAHDAMLSEVGVQFTSAWYTKACQQVGAALHDLRVGGVYEF